MKTKTLLTLLLALSMPVVSIGFTPSFAPKEAKVTFADGEHIHEGNTFTAWSETDSLPGATGYYYLTSDVEISSTWTPAPNTYLCLNGYGIRLTGEGCVIQIAEGKKFNLFDCPFSGVQTHKYTIDETGLATVNDALTENYETFTGGYITGGNGSNGSGISLATGLSNSTTSLIMDGGTIIGNHTTTDGGGISYYWTSGMKGAISLSNATILGNVADKQGGGIFHQASNAYMELKGKNVITRNVSGSAPAGVLEESLIYIQGDLHIIDNHLTNGDPSDLSVSHLWQQPDRLIVSGELAPTSCIGIDTIRRGQIEDYATYNDLDPNTIFSSNSGDIYGIQDGKVVSNIMDEDIEITYDGEGHVPTVTLPDPTITYTIAYGLEEGTYDLDTPPTFTSAGDHRFYYEIVAGLNTRRGHIDVHIVKEDPVVTLAPTAVEDLAYTGEAQTLLVAGTATGGTMQYRIGEGEWSETLPSATSAGTHDVYYRVKGDDLHADLDPVLIQVTISANDKTALSSAINDAQDYLSSVQTAYGPLTGALEEEIENAAAVRDDANKTIAEIADAVTNLNNVKGALASAIAEVEDVKTKINGLDDVITLSSEDGIVAARTAYDALTDAQKSLIDAATLKKLTDAEAAFDGLKADQVVALIEAIGDVSLDKEDEITDARTAYDALNAAQKALIDAETLKKLTDAEAALADIKADHDAADSVIGLIEAIGEVTLEKKDAIDAARNGYDALTDGQKALIDEETLKKLTDAEDAYDTLKANQVVALIEAIGEVTLDKEDEISAARSGYDALNAAQKALIDAETYKKLTDAESTLATLKADKAAADDVVALIDSIGEVTLEKKDAIDAARTAYDALTDEQKAFINAATLKKLTDAEDAYDALKANQVVVLIEAIGEVTLDKEDEITAARKGYDALTDGQKDLIDAETLKKLTDAETALADIKADHAAANDVIGLINAIGEVTLEKKDAIDAARTAYDALTDEQKALIDAVTLKKLTDAEDAYDALKADQVVGLIEAIGEVTLDKEDEITDARNGYDALTDAQKDLIDAATLKKLTDAETELASIKADHAAADIVIGLIDAIGDVGLDKEDEITDARKGYDALTDGQKALIDAETYKKLTDAETELANIKADHAAANDVIGLIDAIGEVTLEKKDAIDAARAAYDALTDGQKALIEATTLKKLTDAESAFDGLKAGQVVALIEAIGDVSLDKEDEITDARTAYDALNTAQKALIDAETLKKLTDAENALTTMKADKAAADDVVALIDAIGDVGFDKEDEISAARTAYDALTDTQKLFVGDAKLNILTDAETTLATMKADKAAADAVIAQIDAIGEVTLEKEDEITDARAAFEALTDAQKAYVGAETLSKLTSAEVAIASLKGDKAAAEQVSNLILGIGEVNLSKENAIVSARNAYNALTDEQKALIDSATLKILTDAEATLATMKADKAAADAVIAQINGIGEVTLDKESAIVAAREAYDALSSEQKALIDSATLQKLVDAETTLATMKADKAAADAVIAQIDAIGEVTLEKEDEITDARAAFEALTDAQKAYVGAETISRLTDAESALATLKADKAAADDVIALIDAIGDVGFDKEDEILLARSAYDALTSAQKAFVDDAKLKILTDAETALATMKADKAAADAVIAQINDIGEVTLDKESAIAAARAAFDALTDAQKAYVGAETLSKLTSAEVALASLKGDKAAAEQVSSLILGIGEVTLDKENTIAAARAAYDALSDEQKTLIDAATLKILTDAEAALATLKADKAAADAVIAQINAIGEVTLDKESAIVAAREAYDALSDIQKAYINQATLKKLTDAEGALAALKGDEAAVAYVEGLIDKIGEVTLEKENAIVTARNAYDALTGHQKELLSPASLQKLVAAENTLAEIKADKAEAGKVQAIIEDIGEVTLDKEDEILAAREAYEALNERAKSFLDETTLQILIDAETTLAALKADKAAIDNATELIDSIGEVTLDKESLIEEARAAYDALTEAQKEHIPEYLVNALNNAEKVLASLKADKAATDAFKALVADIGEIDDSEACRKRIEAAKSAYDSLSEGQKAAVASEYQALLQKEASHNKMVSDKRLFTILAIVGIALGGVVALLLLLYAISFLLLRKFVIEPVSEKAMPVVVMKKKAGIATLLTPRLKKICYPEGELYRNKQEALAVSAKSKAKREDVINAIHAIGEISLEKEEAICHARKSLDALPDPQKAKIDASDIRVLEVAEETLASLKAKAAATHVETLIRQMSKEPEVNPKTVEMARKAYDALSENERSYLSSYSLVKLEEAEALLRDAPKEETKKKKDPKGKEE